MSKRVCAEPGCPKLQPESRCPDHRRAREQARGTPAQRGYDAAHDALRRDYQRRMDQGETFTCWRCSKPIDLTSWHLGHDDHDRSKYRGPECVGCNTATSGRAATPCTVTVVCGPPCAGKTTYVREHAQRGDLVVDYDDIARRLGSPRTHDHDYKYHRQVEATIARAVDGIKAGRHERAWIIRTSPTVARSLAAELSANVVMVDAPDEVLLERASRRRDPQRTARAIREWREGVSHM